MYFLKQCLEQIDGVDSVYFVYWRNDKNTLSDNMRLDLMDIEIYDSDQGCFSFQDYSSIYVMQDEMTRMQAKNDAQQVEIEQQRAEIESLKSMVQQLVGRH